MKAFFTPYNILRLILLIMGIVFLVLFIFVKSDGERQTKLLIIGLFAVAFSNLMGVRDMKK